MKRIKYCLSKLIRSENGQGVVETLIVTVLFFTAVIFAMVQVGLVTINSLICNEAAYATCRTTIVQKTNSDVEDITKKAALFILAPHFSPDNLIPIRATVWTKNPLGAAPEDWENPTPIQIKTHNVNISYAIKIWFASLINPLHTFKFYSGGVPYLTNKARARMIKSPDKSYYKKAYPGGAEW